MLLHVLTLVVAMSGQATPQQAPPKIFNESADGKAQIAAALDAARQDDIPVLILWGGNDEASRAFFTVMYGPSDQTHQNVREKLADEYRVVRVDVGRGDRNLDVARAYGGPAAGGVLPHVTILDTSGKVLASQSSREFAAAAGDGYDAARFLAFLTKYQAPPPPAARLLLTAAIAKAKAGNKEVFVWFSAPW